MTNWTAGEALPYSTLSWDRSKNTVPPPPIPGPQPSFLLNLLPEALDRDYSPSLISYVFPNTILKHLCCLIKEKVSKEAHTRL